MIQVILIDGGYITKTDFYKIIDKLAKQPDWKWPNINNVDKEIAHTLTFYTNFEYSNWESFYEDVKIHNKNWMLIIK